MTDQALRTARRAGPWQHAFRLSGGGLLLLAALLLALRLALPGAVKWYVNRELNRMPGYSGHVDDVGISLWRGAYQLHGLQLRQLSSSSPLPLFSTPDAEISVLWSALFDGRIVAEVVTREPRVNFVAGRNGHTAQAGQGIHGVMLVRRLAGLKVDRFQVVDGRVHYYDPYASPQVDIYLSRIDATATNFTNRENKGGERVAALLGTARAMDQARLDYDLRMDPFAKQPDFTVKARALDVDVTRFRDFSQAYTRINPKKGTLDLVVEADARDGGIQGYVKPLFHDLELFRLDQEHEDLTHPMSLVVDAVGSVLNLVFQNQAKNQLATKVPFSGRLDAPNTDVGSALANVIRNAFVKALSPRFEPLKGGAGGGAK